MPVPDIDQDGDVDVDDLLAVINQWGPCAGTAICAPDTNFDCVVDVNDLLAIINDWGDDPCQGAAEAPPQTVQDCWERYSENFEYLEACLEAISQLP